MSSRPELRNVEVRVRVNVYPTYDVFAPDLINIFIPPEAVFSNQLIVASTQVRIEATRGLVNFIGGSLLGDPHESVLQAPGEGLLVGFHLGAVGTVKFVDGRFSLANVHVLQRVTHAVLHVFDHAPHVREVR